MVVTTMSKVSLAGSVAPGYLFPRRQADLALVTLSTGGWSAVHAFCRDLDEQSGPHDLGRPRDAHEYRLGRKLSSPAASAHYSDAAVVEAADPAPSLRAAPTLRRRPLPVVSAAHDEVSNSRNGWARTGNVNTDASLPSRYSSVASAALARARARSGGTAFPICLRTEHAFS
jgi:hypothetical protein